jgi:sugar lactone lactonase YvrE
MATYSLDSRRVERHDKIHLWNFLGFAWLPDSRRVLYWDVLRGTAVVSDLDGTKVRDLADIPGPSEMKLSRDGRTLLVNRTILEGNIWLLTLK